MITESLRISPGIQDIVCRARMAPFISSALGALKSTESPSLRDKIQSLTGDADQELHRQTLKLIVRSTRVRKIQHPGQSSISQSSSQSTSLLESAPECEALDDRMYDSEAAEDRAELLDDLQEAQDVHASYDDTLSFADIEDDTCGNVLSTLCDNRPPAYGHALDEGPPSDNKLPRRIFDFSDYPLSTRTLLQPVEQVSHPLLDAETFAGAEPYELPRDDTTPQEHGLVHDMTDDDYSEVEHMYAENPVAWAHGRCDSPESIKMDSDLMLDLEVFEDEGPYEMHSGDDASQQQHDLYFECDMEDDGTEHAHGYPLGAPIEWAYGHLEQDTLYESDEQGNELVSDTWSDSNDGDGAPCGNASNDTNMFYEDEEEEFLPWELLHTSHHGPETAHDNMSPQVPVGS
ncbi:unnamed protein product [Discula destructiva]